MGAHHHGITVTVLPNNVQLGGTLLSESRDIAPFSRGIWVADCESFQLRRLDKVNCERRWVKTGS
jgi:hypothetical protein